MAKFTVIIEVDEEALAQARGIDGFDEADENVESIENAIEQEMGWVNQSGISVVSLTPIK